MTATTALFSVFEKRQAYNTSPPDYDGLWKRIIGELFQEFIQFFAPELSKRVDFTKVPEFLQQELYREIIEEKKGKNIADLIVKIYLKNGQEKWILIHVEVNNKVNKDFPKRMFRYFYRIYDKFDRNIYAIALITDGTISKYPDHFHYSFYGTQVEYKYTVYKFHEHTLEELEQLTNPFAAAVIAGKYASQHKNDVEIRYQFKRKLMIQILDRFSGEEKKSRTYISALFHFIEYILQTPDELKSKLREEIIEYYRKDGEYGVRAEYSELSPTLAAIVEELYGKRFREELKEKAEELVRTQVEEQVRTQVEEQVKVKVEEQVKVKVEEQIRVKLKEQVKAKEKEIAVRLLNRGFTDLEIADLTELELADIVALRKEQKK